VRSSAPRKAAPCAELSRRKLAVAYAVESVEATRKKKGGLCSQLAVSLMAKFSDACALYIQGRRGAPRFKRRTDSISLQERPEGARWACGARMDLQRMRRPSNAHRPDRQRLRLALAQDDISI
jgi:hypothetical protein